MIRSSKTTGCSICECLTSSTYHMDQIVCTVDDASMMIHVSYCTAAVLSCSYSCWRDDNAWDICPDSGNNRRAPCGSSLCSTKMAVPGPSSAENVDYSGIEKHEFAQYILREHGTYFPKWGTSERCISQNHSQPHRSEDMSGFVESVPNVKQRVDQIQTQHTEELGKLYARQAEQYLEDALDRYAAQDDEDNTSGYSDRIDVRCSQHSRTPPGDDVCSSRSSIVMEKQAWNIDSFTRRRWCALPMWRPLHHCGTSS
jgi:hypothetical protein